MASYIPSNRVDVEDNDTGIVSSGIWRHVPSWIIYEPSCCSNYSAEARAVREEYLQYLTKKVLCSSNPMLY